MTVTKCRQTTSDLFCRVNDTEDASGKESQLLLDNCIVEYDPHNKLPSTPEFMSLTEHYNYTSASMGTLIKSG